MGGRNILCVSNEILDEYVEIMQRLTSDEVAEYVVKTILNSAFVKFITPYYKYGLIQSGPDDNKFVDCALAASERCIVTNDHHYDVLKTTFFPHVDVMSLVDFHQEIHQWNA